MRVCVQLLAVAAMTAVPLLAQTTQQTPAQFRAGAEVVIVDALVTRGDAPVAGLTAADFSVRDNGVPQTVQLAAVQSVPINLLLALDASASVKGAPLDHLKAAAKAAVASLRPQDQAAVLTFAHNIALASTWTADRARLNQAIDGVAGRGSTALVDAAFAALGVRQNPNSRTLLLIFTDGDDTASWLSPADLVDTARRTDAVIYGVNVQPPGPGALPGDQLEALMLKEPSLYRGALLQVLAHETGGEALRVASTGDLSSVFVNVLSRFNTRYVLTYTPTGVPPSGWHPLDVRVKDTGMQVTARRGYLR